MGTFKEVKGDLIKLAQSGEFDVIVQGVNCQCVQGAGLAPQMVKAFGTDTFRLENTKFKGDIKKLGNIDFMEYEVKMSGVYREDYTGVTTSDLGSILVVVNAYTQFNYGSNHTDGDAKPVDYAAIELCFKKINHVFKGKHIGLPYLIGCGLGGGNIEKVLKSHKNNLVDVDVTFVHYERG